MLGIGKSITKGSPIRSIVKKDLQAWYKADKTQAPLGEEEIANGDFSLGPELVVNRGFATDSAWTKEGVWTISGGTANRTASGSGKELKQTFTTSNTKTWRISFEITSITAGGCGIKLNGGSVSSYYTSPGVHTEYVVGSGTATDIVIRANSAFAGSIDNVSVQQTNPNDSWVPQDTSWVVKDGSAEYTDGSGTKYIRTAGSVATIGKKYKLTYTVSGNTGSLAIFDDGAEHVILNYVNQSVGDYELEFVSQKTGRIRFYGTNNSTGDFSISNISLKEITNSVRDYSKNNNNVVLYSGKALSFDGDDDYVDFGSDINNNGTVWTCVIWLGNYTQGTTGTNSFDWIFGGGNISNLGLRSAGGIFYRQAGGVDPDAYHPFNHVLPSYSGYKRLVFTSNGVDISLYIDGEFISSVTPESTNLKIQRLMAGYDTSSYIVDGSISDFQLYNKTWTASDVTYDWENPDKDVFDRVGEVQVLGEEEITDVDFVLTSTQAESTTGTYWYTGNGWSISGGNATLDGTQSASSSLISNVFTVQAGREYKITVNVESTSAGFRLYADGEFLDFSLDVGEETFYIKASSSTLNITVLGLSGTTGRVSKVSVQEVTTHASHILPTDCTALYRLNEGAGDRVYNAAPVLGAEMWDGTNGDITNWSNFGENYNNPIENDNNAVKITYELGPNGRYIYLKEDHRLNDNLVIGRTYVLSITTKVNQGSIQWRLNEEGENSYSFPVLTSTDFITQSITFIATSVDSHYIYPNNMGTGEEVWIKDISVKPVTLSNSYALAGNPTWVTAQPYIPQYAMSSYSKKMLFDGVDDYVDLNAAIIDTNTWSFNCWVSPSGDGFPDDTGDNWVLFSNETGVAGTVFRLGNPTGKIYLRTRQSTGSFTDHSVSGAGHLEDGVLHMVTVTYNDGDASFYVDGTFLGSTTLTNAAPPTVDMHLGGHGQRFAGMLDEASVFNTELSATEVSELFNGGMALDARDHSQAGKLRGYWRNNGVNQWDDLITSVWTDEGIDETGVTNWLNWDNELTTITNTGGKLKLDTISEPIVSGIDYKGFALGPGANGEVIAGYSGTLGRLNTYAIGDVLDKSYSATIDNNGSNAGVIGFINSTYSTAFYAVSDSSLTHSGTDIRFVATIDDIEFFGNGAFKSITFSDVSITYKRSDPNHGTVNGSPTTIQLQEVPYFKKDTLGLPMNKVRERALNLDGDSYAEIDDDSSLDFGTGEFSIEVWAKANYVDHASFINQIISLGGNGAGAGSASIQTERNSGKITAHVDTFFLTANSPYVNGQWYHIVVTRGVGGICKLYIDAEKQTDEEVSTGAITNSNVKHIGRDSTNDREYTDLIDEPRLYNRALSDKEIERNYKATKSKHKNNTVSNWSDDFSDSFI